MNIYFYQNKIIEEIMLDPVQKSMYYSSFNLNIKTTDNEPYDYYVIPVFFRTEGLEKDRDKSYLRKYLESLQFFQDFSSKHIFILQSDYNPLEFLSEYDVKIFCEYCPKNTNIYSLPFFVDIFSKNIVDKPINDSQYDISFQGCVYTFKNVRERMVDEIKNYQSYKIYLETIPRYFYASVSGQNMAKEKTRYYNNIIDSKFILCPRGTGTTSSRFFETIWFGRIPILIADDTKLPLESIIPWNDLIIRVSEKDMNIDEKIQQFLETKNIQQVSEQLKFLARKHFDRSHLPDLIKLSLLETQPAKEHLEIPDGHLDLIIKEQIK